MFDENNVQPDSSSVQKDAYTVEEVAIKLDMRIRSAYQFCTTTDLFIVKHCGPRLIRINKASFDEWFNKR